MLRRGADGLSDAELLSLVLGGGGGPQHCRLAHALLGRFGTVHALLSAQAHSLVRVPGLGPARTASLKAVLGLAERILEPAPKCGVFLGASTDVSRYLRVRIGRSEREIFGALFLDSQHRLIEYRELFFGTLDSATVHPREVLKAAMELNAGAVILAHNHPSGVAEPSRADVVLTERLRSVLALVDIRLLDHLVVAPDRAVSMAERGLL